MKEPSISVCGQTNHKRQGTESALGKHLAIAGQFLILLAVLTGLQLNRSAVRVRHEGLWITSITEAEDCLLRMWMSPT